jgi:N-acetylglucosaminyl-diphospho-decaprenol L-rhamnosyltransferase
VTEATVSSPLDVVVVAYRSGAVIGRCLAVARRFAPAGARFVVVDNSPDDRSAALAARELPSAIVLPQSTNVGYAAAANRGIAAGSAPFVLLLNPDVVELQGSYDSVARIFSSEDRVAAVTVRLRDEEGTLMHCRREFRWLDFLGAALSLDAHLPRRWRWHGPALTEWDHDDEREVDATTGAALFLRRTAYEEIGPLDERFFMYWEETDWLRRARHAGWKLVFTPAVDARHLNRRSSDVDGSTYSELLLESSYRYVGKHFGRLALTGMRATWILADLARLLRALIRHDRLSVRRVRRRLQVHVYPRRHAVRPV